MSVTIWVYLVFHLFPTETVVTRKQAKTGHAQKCFLIVAKAIILKWEETALHHERNTISTSHMEESELKNHNIFPEKAMTRSTLPKIYFNKYSYQILSYPSYWPQVRFESLC